MPGIELARELGGAFVDWWKHATWFERGEGIGEAIGYGVMTLASAALSDGVALEVSLTAAAAKGSKLAELAIGLTKVLKLAQDPWGEIASLVKESSAAGDLAKLQKARQAEALAEEAAKAKAAADRLATFDRALPADLEGRLVANDALGSGARVTYGNGVRIEFGADADAAMIEAHVRTARYLMRFEGPLGSIDRMLNAIAAALGLAKKLGTRGFEAEQEIAKLTALADKLRGTRADITQTIDRVGSAANVGQDDLDKLDRQLDDIEAQIAEHETELQSTEAGRGYVAAGDPVANIRSMVGERAQASLKKYVFEGAEAAQALEEVRAKARAAGLEAFEHAKQARKTEQEALRAGQTAVSETAKNEAARLAIEAAQRRADRAIADGSVFDPNAIDSATKEQLARYARGETGQAAARLAPSLDGMTEQAFLESMEHEMQANSAITKKQVMIPGPKGEGKQPMTVWEYPDGTTVRFKPRGDNRRPRSVSIEVKRVPSAPDSNINDQAFKLNTRGEPVPATGRYIQNPYEESDQHIAFANRVLEPVHFGLR